MMVGLYDVDSKIPNLALMKISAWHKNQGQETELFVPLKRHLYSKVYASKVFSFSHAAYLDDGMDIGGTGSIRPSVELSDDIESQDPDYSLYRYPHNIGFLMRGCRLRCKFCVVPKKEGKARSVRTVHDIWTQRTSKFLVLLDNDFFGNPEWKERIAEIRDIGLQVNFSQGINVRILTDEQAEALASVEFRNLNNTKKQVHFAWDNPRDEKLVLRGIDIAKKAGIHPYQMAFYVLIGYHSSEQEDLHRVNTLKAIGADPFVMPYDRKDPYQQRFARWVNHRAIFKSISWDEYKKEKKPVVTDQSQSDWVGYGS